jgi:hypothetical protein
MTCRKYENALFAAAESKCETDADLTRHLEHCSTCRMTLQSEKELFSRIDDALRAQVNEDPSTDFLPQLRLRLSKELTGQTVWDGIWHVAGAALALILLAVLYPMVHPRQPSVLGSSEMATARVTESNAVARSARYSEELAIRPRHRSKPLSIQRVVPPKPEVLVPSDEQQAFAQFVACVARRDAMAEAVVRPASNQTVNRNTELPQVSSVEVADLQLGRSGPEEWIKQISSE